MANQFWKLYSNRSAGFDARGLAKILDATYTDLSHSTEHLTKTGFAPSTLFWNHGSCSRYWYLAFNGAEFVKAPDAYSIDNMQSGTDAHRRMQANFEASGLEIENEYEIFNDDPPIHAFVDAIVRNYNGKNVVVEIKTTRAEAFAYLVAKNQGREYQVMQLLLYMHLLGEEHGALIYENKNDHNKLLIPVQMTGENKEKIEKVITWMRKVYDNYVNGELPTNPFRKNSRICKGCPIRKWCFDQEEGTIKIDTLKYSTEDKDDNS